MGELSVLQQRLAERRANKPEQVASKPPGPSLPIPAEFQDDIPEDPYERTPEETGLDAVLNRVDILEAYALWCGKMTPRLDGRKEGVKISCPIPNHPDKDPSAWINLDKQTWYCGGCQIGGDKYDIAAYRKGISNYKSGANFHKLRELMAADLGYVIKKSPAGQSYIESQVRPDQTSPDVPQASAPHSVPQAPPPPGATTSVAPDAPPTPPVQESSGEPEHQTREEFEDELDASLVYPNIDWRKVAPPDTFLYRWMEECTKDDLPEEYYFWLGLQAIGFAIGRQAFLHDHTPVFGNLFICLLGRSGVGKSRAINALSNLLREALPYDHADSNSTGTLSVAAPGSAEALIDTFAKPVVDPANPKTIAYYSPVRGYLKFDELATLASRASRTGSALKPILMEFYDANETIEVRSRTHGYSRAEKPFCSTVTTSQPKAIRELLGKSDLDSGFVNRWVFAVGPEKTKFDYLGVSLDISSLVPLLKTIKAWASPGKSFELVEEPRQRWKDCFYDEIEPLRKRDANDLYTRVDLTLKKIIVLLTANALLEQPTYDIVDASCRLLEYLIQAYSTVEKNVHQTVSRQIEDDMTAFLNKRKTAGQPAIKMRDIKRALKPKGYTDKQLIDSVKELVATGTLEEILPVAGGRGRPTITYKVIEDEV